MYDIRHANHCFQILSPQKFNEDKCILENNVEIKKIPVERRASLYP